MKALVFTLAEARVERDKARLLVMQGINPSTQRKYNNAKADALHTFSALAAEWIGEDGKQWTERYRQQLTKRLQQDAFPTLGNLNVQDITARHVGDMLAIVKARSPTAAKHLQAWAGAVFRFAAKKALIDNDPSYPWRGSIKGHKVEHHPPLPEKTLPAFLRSMDKTSAEFQIIHTETLQPYATGSEMQTAELPDGKLAYCTKVNEEILGQLLDLAGGNGIVVVYSWQPGWLRQYLPNESITVEQIPAFLINRFGGDYAA